MLAPMRRLGFILAVLAAPALIAAAAGPASTQRAAPDQAATVAPRPDAAPPPEAAEAPGPAPAPAVKPPRSAMMVEIEALFEAARIRVEELRAQAAAAPDAMAFLELQRQIERLHRDTELAILQVQADHARRAGHEEAARRIEAAIALAQEPPPVARRAARPAPAGQ